jgi:hypothetical protein
MSPNLEQAAASLSELYRNAGKSISNTEQQQLRATKHLMKALATPLLQQMGITAAPDQPGLAVVDLACGGGVVVQELQALLPREVLQKSSFLASDNSAALVELVNKRIVAEGWVNTKASVLDAQVCRWTMRPALERQPLINLCCEQNTGLDADSFTHATIAMGLHLIPNPDAALRGKYLC